MAIPNANRVLIYRLGSLGDTVVALPCLHLIARTWPNAERRLLTNAPIHAKAPLSAAVLGISEKGSGGLIHGVMDYPVGTRSLGGLLALRKQLGAYKPDVLVYLGPVRGIKAAKRDAMFFSLCGIDKIIGLPDTEELQRCQTLQEVLGWVRPEAPILGEIAPLFTSSDKFFRNLELYEASAKKAAADAAAAHAATAAAAAQNAANAAANAAANVAEADAAAPASTEFAAASEPEAAARWHEGLRQTGHPPDIGLPVEELLEPEASRLARCLAALGDARVNDPASWDLLLTAEEKRAAAEALGPVAGHPILAAAIGTKVQAKDWGTDNWIDLLAAVSKEHPNHRLVLLGAAEESADSNVASFSWRERALNLCGKLTPRETAAVLAQAELFLGVDSGPMHLAAAVGTPVVAIFAARNIPVHWFPKGTQHRVLYHRTDCWGCGLETCIEQKKKCLTSITVDETMVAIRKSFAAIAGNAGKPAGA